jgi:site-specific recombinase XerD
MTEELQRRNYSQATIESYILAVKEFAEYCGKSPASLGAEDVRRYQLYLINEKKLAPHTVKVRMSALRWCPVVACPRITLDRSRRILVSSCR